MALTDSAVVIPAVGHVFTHLTAGTDPWSLAQLNTFISAGTVPSGWLELGHTNLDSPVSFDQSGGDTEVKGTWQNPALRQAVTSAVVDSFTVPAEQVLDNDVLKLYYGGGDASVANQFDIPDVPTPQERACMVVILDGAVPLGWGFPKVAILRADNLSVDPTDFLKAPLLFTVLKFTGKTRMRWVNDALGA